MFDHLWSIVRGFACLLLIAPIHSQTASSSSARVAQPAAAFERFASNVKDPVDWFDWGGDIRVRNEYYDNIVSLRDSQQPLHEQDVIRYRGRVWASLLPFPGLSLNTRLSAEPREWFRPAFVGAYKEQTGMEWRYGVFDLLNLKYTNAFQQPLTITVGRQDLFFGDYWNWWLVADGTPGDGSWSFFLDSARLTYDLSDLKTRLDLVYIDQRARPDGWLPTLNRSSECYLTEQNEQGLILYASNKSLRDTQLDGYFIYKRDEQVLSFGDNADIFTVGGRVVGNPWNHWQYYAEGAYQFGQKQDPTVKVPVPVGTEARDIDAFGANARLTYLVRDPLNDQLHLVGEFLSGDDPKTPGRDEMFDILWGRWPRFSEGYIYSYIQETGGRIAQLNNIGRLGAGWSINPVRNMTFSAYYNAWFAPEAIPTRTVAPSSFSENGHFRGHYVQTVLRHQFNKHISAHLWGEFLWEGDYYREQDLMEFLRAEVLFAF